MERVDLIKDEKKMTQIIVILLVVAAVAVVIGLPFAPFGGILAFGNLSSLTGLFIFLLIYIIFIFIHELIHIIFMKIFSPAKVTYGISWSYAYAGSEGYFTKRQHMVVGLSPVVVIGAFLLVLTIVLPMELFWTIHIWQVINLSSAAGDFFMANYLRKQPSDMLIQDDGPAMTIFHRA